MGMDMVLVYSSKPAPLPSLVRERERDEGGGEEDEGEERGREEEEPQEHHHRCLHVVHADCVSVVCHSCLDHNVCILHSDLHCVYYYG